MADDLNQIVSRTSRPSVARPTRRDPSPTLTPSRPSQAGPRPLRSRRILYVFSGPARPFDGLAAIAALVGVSVDEVDTLHGGSAHDVLRATTREHYLDAVRSGVYCAAIVATPCTSFAVARGNDHGGAAPFGLRTFEHESGPPDASEVAKAFVRKHDTFVDFTVDVAHAALDLGMELIIENPAPRNDPRLASYWPERAHLPQLWDMRRVRELRQRRSLTLMVVPQCAFGPGPHGLLFQKYTGLLLSRGAAARLADLRHLRCNHAKHDAVACGDDAALAAAYPAALNDALLWGLTGVRRLTPLPGAAPSADTPTPKVPHPRVAPPFDRDVSTGRIADGPGLSSPIRAAVDAARSKRKRWASHRNLVPASEAELRAATMPDLLPHAGATSWPGPPSQPGAAARLDEFRRALGGRNVHIGDLWEPAEWERFQRWMQRARRGVYQPPARFPQSSLVPLARGYVWDTRDPQDCRPMEPSDIGTTFPGRRQIDRRAFRRLARELGSLDEDIIGQVGGGGVESRSRCELTSELHAHAPGVAEHPEAAAKAVDEELGEEWALGPFYLPPTVPIRALPRDVIMQQRSRVIDDQGTIEDYEKPRITLNPSAGPDSVNAGIPPEERSVALTTARDLGYGLALIDVPARDAGVGVAGYGVDMTSAYSFLQVQRLDWWQFAYIWFDAAGAAHFRLLIRVGFGGAMSPRRFQSVSVIITTLARRWQREFDEQHPPPEAVLRWRRARQRLQRAGSLPPGDDQLAAAIAGVYIDDLAGGCCDDDVPMPDTWQGMSTAGVNLGAPAAFGRDVTHSGLGVGPSRDPPWVASG